jgi:hypothetical protein
VRSEPSLPTIEYLSDFSIAITELNMMTGERDSRGLTLWLTWDVYLEALEGKKVREDMLW